MASPAPCGRSLGRRRARRHLRRHSNGCHSALADRVACRVACLGLLQTEDPERPEDRIAHARCTDDPVDMDSASTPVTCVLVDDHPAILRALELVLADYGIDVVGSAATGAEALDVLARERPAVALIDLRLPDVDGIEIVERAAETAPDTACILYTGYAQSADSRNALDAGARGVVSKEAPLADVSRAIRRVAAGGVSVDSLLGAPPAADPPALT